MKIEFLQVTEHVSGPGADEFEDEEYTFFQKTGHTQSWVYDYEIEDDVYISCHITRSENGCRHIPQVMGGVSYFSFEGELYKTGVKRGRIKSAKLRFRPKEDPGVRSVLASKARKNVRRRA